MRLAFAGDDRGFGVDAPSSPSTDCDIRITIDTLQHASSDRPTRR
jgi:hypothetical protein